MKVAGSTALMVCALATSNATGWVLAGRWVERIGNTDVVIGGDGATAVFADQAIHRVRMQLGLFDDDAGPAPAGGLYAWRDGTLDLTSTGTVPLATRTPGCIAPFNQSTRPNSNGSPFGDPFTHLTDIDAIMRPNQTPFWGCGPDGMPLPEPLPTIFGRNEFISVFEFSIQHTVESVGVARMEAGGRAWDVGGWATVGTPLPPDCERGLPGAITWAPTLPSERRMVGLTLNIVPGPAGAWVVAIGMVAVGRRARERQRGSVPAGG